MSTKLDDARKEIEEVDRGMAALFERRMRAVEAVAAYKKEHGLPVYDPAREKALIEKNSAYISDPEIREYYVRYIENTMAVSRAYQIKLLEEPRAPKVTVSLGASFYRS